MTYPPKNPLAAACAVLVFCSFAAWSDDTTTSECPQALAENIPERSLSAKSATDVLQMLVGVDDDKREAIIRDEMIAGNVPKFMRTPAPVVVHPQSGSGATVTLCVLPDYLSIGSEADFVIVPMQLKTARAVARRYGFVLPTPRIVDAIYEQAGVHLTLQPLPAGEQMRSTNYFWRHNELLSAQRATFGEPLGMLIAGHKKDLVITNRLWDHLDRVAIYGWHRTDRHPIQPLSTVHGERYADYSHGVRLVSQTAYVDGRATPLLQLLEDPQWSASRTDPFLVGRPITPAFVGLESAVVSEPHAADRQFGTHAVRKIEAIVRWLEIAGTRALPFMSVAEAFAFGCAYLRGFARTHPHDRILAGNVRKLELVDARRSG